MASKPFPVPSTQIVGILVELFRHQKNANIVEILESAASRIEQTDWDNWDGGIDIYTLFLELPVKQFAPLDGQVEALEKAIAAKFATIIRAPSNQVLRHAVIAPALVDAGLKISQAAVPDAAVAHIWDTGCLRLFLSHVSKYKERVVALKRDLLTYRVSGFVAHEDIEPSLEWQNEIELALRSTHALAALLTPDFKASNWTDQEIGIALGKGAVVIPVRLGLNPYGFIGKNQALAANLDDTKALASTLVDILLKQKGTSASMREHLIVALEKANSFAAAKIVWVKLETLQGWSDAALARVQKASVENNQVTGSFGVPERIKRLVERERPKPVEEDVPF